MLYALPQDHAWIMERLAGPGWAVCPDFIKPAALTSLAAEARALWEDGAFRHARVGVGDQLQLRPEVRSDYVHWLNEYTLSPALADYYRRIEQLRLELNQALYLGLFNFEAHLTVYPPGSFYHRHLDQFRDTRHRIVSCVLYLNDDWQSGHGGQLRMYMPGSDDYKDVLPRGGTLVVFLSNLIEHEVLPATRERFSLTGWLRLRESLP